MLILIFCIHPLLFILLIHERLKKVSTIITVNICPLIKKIPIENNHAASKQQS